MRIAEKMATVVHVEWLFILYLSLTNPILKVNYFNVVNSEFIKVNVPFSAPSVVKRACALADPRESGSGLNYQLDS